MEIMQKHLNKATDKNTLSFLQWGIDNLLTTGKDCFEMQRLCIAFASNTGIKPTEFYNDLNSIIEFK